MDEGERDSTQDWVLPAEARPVTIAQLEQRVDHALAVARASEAAALEIGAAAIDAAEQARRAAELAELASERAVSAAPNGTEPAGAVAPVPNVTPIERPNEDGDGEEFDSFRHFCERADRVIARLRAIEELPR